MSWIAEGSAKIVVEGRHDSKIESKMVFFYPHSYLRDRQLDVIRRWTGSKVLNPDLATGRTGSQVSRDRALANRTRLPLHQRLPLINVKLRPRGLPRNAAVYVWGGIVATGLFILDLDNPYAMTGYNLRAMSIYRKILAALLRRPRCLDIYCLSRACRETLGLLFGPGIYERARVRYPFVRRTVDRFPRVAPQTGCRFLFVGTQFEIKGGRALLRAFRRVHDFDPAAKLTVVTHLPTEYAELANSSGVALYPAEFSRDEIVSRFILNADVLVHPTYMESFGMVVLEAIAHGVAVISTDVYALPEMVRDGINGTLLKPPVSAWKGYAPSVHYFDSARLKTRVKGTDTQAFEAALADAMIRLASDKPRLEKARQASWELFEREFAAE